MMHSTNIRTIGLCLLLVLVGSGCGPSEATLREEVDTGMKSWVGKSENELVAKWGAPTKSYKTNDGTRELTYIYTRTSSSPGYVWHDYWGTPHYSHPTRHQTKTQRSFTVDTDGTIVAYHWEGL